MRKYVLALEERGLIVTEPADVRLKNGRCRNGNLKYTLLSIQKVPQGYYPHQLRIVETYSPPMLVTNFSHKHFRRLSHPEHDKPFPIGCHWHRDEELPGRHRLYWNRLLQRSRLYH